MACTVITRPTSFTICAALLTVALALTTACAEPTRPEKLVGTYSYSNGSPNFPIYFDITVQGKRVSGRAFDGNMEESSISGTLEGASYSFVLHPLKQGSSPSQDIWFRGTRSDTSVTGGWEHVVGAKGAWSVKATNLPPSDAIKQYQIPCKPSESASRNSTERPCAKNT